jgi:hypothetical protein
MVSLWSRTIPRSYTSTNSLLGSNQGIEIFCAGFFSLVLLDLHCYTVYMLPTVIWKRPSAHETWAALISIVIALLLVYGVFTYAVE